MRALKINFGGAQNVSVDWGSQVSGATEVAQKAAVAVMTQRGSDRILPKRGTDVTRTLLSYGAFDLLGIQHLLNFGSIKAASDIQEYENEDQPDESKVSSVQMTLINVKDRGAEVGVVVTNLAGQETNEIVKIA